MQDRLIRQMRESLGLTQQAFADLLQVSQATVSRWEAGRVIPDGPMRRRIHDMVRERGGMADAPLLSMIRRTPAPAGLFDLDMRIQAVSDVVCQINGVSPGEAIGMDYRPRFTEEVEEAYEAALAHGLFLGDCLGLELVCRVAGLRDGLMFHTISTWHVLPRPSTGQPLLAWTSRHVEEDEFHAALAKGRIKVLSLDDWMSTATSPVPA